MGNATSQELDSMIQATDKLLEQTEASGRKRR
jgi:hypothetical protein